MYYARYADTILLDIQRIPNFFNVARAKEHARTILKNYCDKLGLDVSYEEITFEQVLLVHVISQEMSLEEQHLCSMPFITD